MATLSHPEMKAIRLKLSNPPTPMGLSSLQKNYFELLKGGQFCVVSLFEYCRPKAIPISFIELWELLLKLDEAGILVEPRIREWQFRQTDTKITKISLSHAGKEERATVNDLQQLPFFRHLQPQLLELLASLSSVYQAREGTFICRQGEKDRALFVLLEGQASIYRTLRDNETRTLIAKAQKGSILGEVSFFLGTPRSSDIMISKAAKLIKINFVDRLNGIINTAAAERLRERFLVLQGIMSSESLRSLSDLTGDTLLQSCLLRPLNENQVLFKEGQLSDALYVVIQGSLLITQKQQKINVARAGDLVGEIGFIHKEHRRTATATAQTSALLMQIPYQRLIELVFQHLPLGVIIEKEALARLSRDSQRRASAG